MIILKKRQRKKRQRKKRQQEKTPTDKTPTGKNANIFHFLLEYCKKRQHIYLIEM